MKNSRNIQIINYIFFMACLFAYTVITLLLFHRQSMNHSVVYVSDIHPYIQWMQGIKGDYSFPYPLLFALGKCFQLVFSPENAFVIALTLLNSLTAVFMKYYFDRELLDNTSGIYKSLFSTLAVFALLFMSMLYPLTYLGHYNPMGEGYLYRYMGVFSPNPYHNATYLAARAFTVPCFFLFISICKNYEKANKWICKDYILFGLFLLLSTLTKPSFTLVFVMLVGLTMLYKLLRSRGKNWIAFFQFGIWFIPTFLVLLYQFGGVFRPSEEAVEAGVGIGFMTAWSTVCEQPVRAILLGAAFPIIVLIVSLYKKTASEYLKQSWWFYLLSLFTLAFLYEKGFRLEHVNFSWGYMYGLFYLYLCSLLELLRMTFTRKHSIPLLIIQWSFCALHLLCGLDYYVVLLRGGLFH